MNQENFWSFKSFLRTLQSIYNKSFPKTIEKWI